MAVDPMMAVASQVNSKGKTGGARLRQGLVVSSDLGVDGIAYLNVNVNGYDLDGVRCMAGVFPEPNQGVWLLSERRGKWLCIGCSSPTPWHYIGDPGEPAFQNSWVNYDTPGWGKARFCRNGLFVEVEMILKNGTNNTPAFTLPPGYRPQKLMLWACLMSPDVVARVQVETGGNVVFTVSNVGWTSANFKFSVN